MCLLIRIAIFSVWGGVKIDNCVTISHGVKILTSGLDTSDYPNKCICKGNYIQSYSLKPLKSYKFSN